MIHLFCGYDERESIGWHVFVASVLRRTTQPVAIHRLDACGLPQGSNAFTLSRFLVPWMMGYQGHAIFADASDMLMLGDVAELDSLFDSSHAVQVVPHNYRTRHPIKYIGTTMQADNLDYDRKNWASLMLFNCQHALWRGIDPKSLDRANKLHMLQFFGLPVSDWLGALSVRWNVLADEGQPVEGANVLHWTAGIPGFAHYANAPGAEHWHAELAQMIEHA